MLKIQAGGVNCFRLIFFKRILIYTLNQLKYNGKQTTINLLYIPL